jgi:hypothetical protein
LAGSPKAADCAPSKQGAAPTLVVQVVDELWLPLPGAVVSARLKGSDASCISATAGSEGIARLAVSQQGSYDIEASMIGFKTKRVKGVGADANASKSIPHVQVKLKVAVAETVI